MMALDIIWFNIDLYYSVFLGEVFFERGKRMFATDLRCDTCVVVHNNWIVSAAAKKYRFKEFLLWDLDTDGY